MTELIGIPTGQHVLHGAEPPHRFVHQFNYIQNLIGNPNTTLTYQDNLSEGGCGWFHFVAGSTGAKFILPQKTPKLDSLLNFFTWYDVVMSKIPSFSLDHSCCKKIQAFYSHGKELKEFALKGWANTWISRPSRRRLEIALKSCNRTHKVWSYFGHT